MSAIVIANPTATEPTPPAPTRPAGGPYRFCMIFDAGRRRAFADTARDLLPLLIADYPAQGSPVAAAAARLEYAVRCQTALQAQLLADPYALRHCDPTERQLLMSSRAEPPQIQRWSGPVPLVLVTTFYAPTTFRPRPEADGGAEVWWIDPSEELTLLQDLHRYGLLHLSTVATREEE